MLRTFAVNETTYKTFKITCAREGEGVGETLVKLIEEYNKKHADSNNPQTTIVQFDKKEVMAIPNLYETNPKKWNKFFGLMNKDDYEELVKQHNMLTKKMNQKYQELTTL